MKKSSKQSNVFIIFKYYNFHQNKPYRLNHRNHEKIKNHMYVVKTTYGSIDKIYNYKNTKNNYTNIPSQLKITN